MTAHPFLGTEALAAGRVSRRTLRRYRSIHRDVYLAPGGVVTPTVRAGAGGLWSGRTAIAGGLAASALDGPKWIDPAAAAELFRVNGKPVNGILIHRDVLQDGEYQLFRGIPVTTPARTAFDLGRRKGPTLAVERVDALANQTGVTASEVFTLIDRHPGVRGLVQLRTV